MANDSWSGQDKAQHFIASAMLSAAGNEYSQHQGMSRSQCHVWIDVLCQFGGVKRALG